jgi:hypothetical protein
MKTQIKPLSNKERRVYSLVICGDLDLKWQSQSVPLFGDQKVYISSSNMSAMSFPAAAQHPNDNWARVNSEKG